MKAKIFPLLLLSLSLISPSSRSKAQSPKLQNLKMDIFNQAMMLGLKVSIGAVLVIVTAYSLIQVGQLLQVWFNQLQNGFVIELSTFASVAVMGSLLLFFLFQFKSQSKKESIESVENAEIDLTALGLIFFEGFLESLDRQEKIRSRIQSENSNQKGE